MGNITNVRITSGTGTLYQQPTTDNPTSQSTVSINTPLSFLNVGGGVGLFEGEHNNSYHFKSLIAGAGIIITPTSNNITISSNLVSSRWIIGTGVPSIMDSNFNDIYYDSSTGNIYNNLNAEWRLAGTISGPAGPPGPAGGLSNVSNVGDGIPLIYAFDTSSLAIKTVSAGSNITIDDDGLGNLTITSSPGISSLTLTGDIFGTGTSTISTNLSPSGVSAGTYNTVIVNTKGIVTSALNAPYLTSANSVISVAGRSGLVTLTYSDIAGLATVAHSGSYIDLIGVPTNVSEFNNDSGYIKGTTITGSQINLALGFTPYSNSNPAGYITSASISVPTLISAFVNDSGYIKGTTITGSQVDSALGYTPIDNSLIGAPNGIAVLDSAGKILMTELPSVLTGAVVYQGIWNANTNSPTLSSGVGTKGQYYKVNIAGSTNIDGTNSWSINDMIIFNGTRWDKISGGAAPVTSVNSFTGDVTITTITGNAGTSTKWASAKTLSISGDASGSNSIDGSTNVAIPLTLSPSGVSAGTYNTVIVNAKGIVTSASNTPYLTSASAPVVSVAGRSGSVTLTYSDIGGLATVAHSGLYSDLTGVPTNISTFNNDSGYIKGTTITGSQVDLALGFTPYNISNPAGYITNASIPSVPSLISSFVNDSGYITNTKTIGLTGDVTGSGSIGTIAASLKYTGTAGTYTKVTTDPQGRVTSGTALASLDVTVALTFTPYNISNPAGYLTAATLPTLISSFVNDSGYIKGTTITGSQVDLALGFTPYSISNPAGYITGTTITGSQIDLALGFTPYSNSNPAGYITSASVSITGSQVNTALGYTPVSKSGDSMFGALTVNNNLTVTGTLIPTNVAFTGYVETANSVTQSSGVLTLNLLSGSVFYVTMTAAITSITFTNIPASGKVVSFILNVTVAGYTITWPASVKWANGTAPTLSTTSGKTDIFSFFTYNGGTTWFAAIVGQNF